MADLLSYQGPWAGVSNNLPKTGIPPNASPYIDNFLLRNGEIVTWPKIVELYGTTDFDSANKNNADWQTIWFDEYGLALYAMDSYGQFYINTGAGFISTGTAVTRMAIPIQVINYNNVLYGPNGLDTADTPKSGVWSYDGTTFTKKLTDSIYNSKYFNILNAHLIAANLDLFIGLNHTLYPSRIAWSASGLPGQWDATINTNAGFSDLNISEITGLLNIGRSALVFARNQIIEMIPTGNGLAPFNFQDFSRTDTEGIGCMFSLSLASMGEISCFIGQDDVFLFSQFYGIRRIGGPARDAIFTDFISANDTALLDASAPSYFDGRFPAIMGHLIPRFQGFDYTYPCYIITIPLSTRENGSIVWIYDLATGSWTRRFIEGWITSRISNVVTYNPNLRYQTVLSTSLTVGAGANHFKVFEFDVTELNSEDSSEYQFRTEVTDGKSTTVNRVRVTYRDIGIATLTFTMSGNYPDNQGGADTNFTVTKTIDIGTALANGVVRTTYVDFEQTFLNPQLTITRASNAGAVALTKLTLMGGLQEGSNF